jgi:ER-derived vesicles protein
MAQIRGTAGYNLGHQSPFATGPGRQDATSDPSPLEQIREQTSKIEDWLDTLSDPIKPYVFC